MRGKLFLVVWVTIVLSLVSFRFVSSLHFGFDIPSGWPKPTYDFKKNTLTETGFQLGRNLFYDPILSRDSSISCASCHLQFSGFTHIDHAVSHGIDGRIGKRNSPVLINLAWNKTFHWDGGVLGLEGQALNPIAHQDEMDNTLPQVLKRLNRSKKYKSLFANAFGDSLVSTSRFLKAMAQFTVTLVSSNSKYDQVMRKEKGVQFTDQEQNGLNLFRSNCVVCHKEPLFTNGNFASNGLTLDMNFKDIGRFAITQNGKDSLRFKIPTLRNSEFSFPYMHDGRFNKLKDVINYYSDSLNVSAHYLSKELKKPMRFSDSEKKDLLAFLLTLSDKQFLYNKRFYYPK